MKKSPFKQKSLDEVKAKQLARLKIYQAKSIQNKKTTSVPSLRKKTQKKPKLKPLKKLKNDLKKASHTFVKNRDAFSTNPYKGECITCGKYVEAGDFQAGHFEPSGSCGVLLRYHPHNIHGQGGFCCNINRNGQQKMANEYTMWMINKYGHQRVVELRELKRRSVNAGRYFYETMLELYEQGDEAEIIKFIESYI